METKGRDGEEGGWSVNREDVREVWVKKHVLGLYFFQLGVANSAAHSSKGGGVNEGRAGAPWGLRLCQGCSLNWGPCREMGGKG